MKIRAADFVTLPVSDLAAAARFYREVLGLHQDFLSEEHQWAEFDCGNVTLALHGGQPEHPAGGFKVAVAVDDIAAAYKELGARGVRLPSPPRDWGVCQSLELLDPDNNTLLLHHRADGTFGRPG